MINMEKAARLFSGWNETMVWSCLQGCMGYLLADDDENPIAAQIVSGDFCFFAGTPNAPLAAKAAAPILVPQNEGWSRVIEDVWGSKAERTTRYAIQKEPDVFDISYLTGYIAALPGQYTLRMFDRQIYDASLLETWSSDFCSQFRDYDDFSERGIGTAVLYEGRPVAGASSYIIYHGGIEIEIDTKPEFRRRGLATVCGAKLILECLKRGLYPSWDAVDLRSVALAEKLGYHMDHPYPAYVKRQAIPDRG